MEKEEIFLFVENEVSRPLISATLEDYRGHGSDEAGRVPVDGSFRKYNSMEERK